MYNLHHWNIVIPLIVQEDHFQQQFGVNLWESIMDCRITGLFELLPRSNGARYLQFLRNDFQNLLMHIRQ